MLKKAEEYKVSQSHVCYVCKFRNRGCKYAELYGEVERSIVNYVLNVLRNQLEFDGGVTLGINVGVNKCRKFEALEGWEFVDAWSEEDEEKYLKFNDMEVNDEN